MDAIAGRLANSYQLGVNFLESGAKTVNLYNASILYLKLYIKAGVQTVLAPLIIWRLPRASQGAIAVKPPVEV